jgi:peptidoglycan/LPS O-acetylase OafA/YrhL
MFDSLTVEQETTLSGPAQVSPHKPAPGFRPDIEGMRAAAILMVVAFHAGIKWIGGGFIGVDVFFVLSGYLITELLVNEIERTGKLSFRKFYGRRAKRLLPASLTLAICTLLFAITVLSPTEVVRVAQTALATGSYASNVWFLVKSTDYFGLGVDSNPLLHTWSLAVEEQFYFVWPLLVLLCMRRSRPRRVAAVVFSGLALFSYASCVWLTKDFQPIAFFSTPTRTWEFAAGGLGALLQGTRFFKIFRSDAAAWVGAALVLVAAIWFRSTQGFPGAIAIVPVVGTVLILMAGKYSVSPRGLFLVLKHRIAQRLGGLSYSWYLWHWPVLVFGRILFPSPSALVTGTLVVIGFAAALLSYTFIEGPIRFSPRLNKAPAAALALGAGMTITGLLVSGLVLTLGKHLESSPSQIAYLRASMGSPEHDKCATGFRSDQLILCSFGDVNAQTLVLFGDSHAGQWVSAMESARFAHWHVVTVLKSACPSVSVPTYNPHLQREDDNCARWRAKAIDYLRKTKPAVVIICNSSGYVRRPFFDDPYATNTLLQWQDGMRKTLTGLDTGVTSTLIVRDTPRPGFDVPVCLSRAASHPRLFSPKDCITKENSPAYEPVWQAERGAAVGLAHVATLDLTDQFCRAGFCNPVVDNVVVYRDGNHITGDFAILLGSFIEEEIQRMGDSVPQKEQYSSSLPSNHRGS